MFVPMYCHNARIEHVDTDAYGVVHFSRYASMAETAILNCMAAHDLSLEQIDDIGLEIRVRMIQLKFLSSAKYRDELEITVYRPTLTAAVIRFNFAISISKAEIDIAEGSLELVCVSSTDGSPTRLPNQIINLLGGTENGQFK